MELEILPIDVLETLEPPDVVVIDAPEVLAPATVLVNDAVDVLAVTKLVEIETPELVATEVPADRSVVVAVLVELNGPVG